MKSSQSLGLEAADMDIGSASIYSPLYTVCQRSCDLHAQGMSTVEIL